MKSRILLVLAAACLVLLTASQSQASITFINHVEAGCTSSCSGSGGGATTGTVDMTGANWIVGCLGYYQGAAGKMFMDDSLSNTYTARGTERCISMNTCVRCFEKISPTVGSSMTFSAFSDDGMGGHPDNFTSIVVMGFSGVKTSSPYDSNEVGTTGSAVASIQPGSITPSEANEVVIAAVAYDDTATIAVNSGFVNAPYQIQFSFGNHYGLAATYLIQTSAAAVNPTFSWTGNRNPATTQMSFKATASATRPPQRRRR